MIHIQLEEIKRVFSILAEEIQAGKYQIFEMLKISKPTLYRYVRELDSV